MESEKPQDEMESEKYLPELMAEKDTLDPSFRHSLRLLDQGKKKNQWLYSEVNSLAAENSPQSSGLTLGVVLPATWLRHNSFLQVRNMRFVGFLQFSALK